MALFGQRIRSARLREARKQRLKKITALSAGLIVALLVLFSQGSRIPETLISEIDIRGNEVISKSDIKSLVQESINGTYLFYFAKKQ